MRKLIIITVLAMSLGGICKAGKPTNYDNVDNIHGNIRFNVEISSWQFSPMVVNLDGTAITDDGGRRGIRVEKNVGTSTTTILIGKDLYRELPTWARPLLKELYQEALDEDLSD